MKIKFLWSMLPILAISTVPINLLSTIDPSSLIKDAITIENNDQLTAPIEQKSRIAKIEKGRFWLHYEIIVNKDVINEWRKYAASKWDLLTIVYADLMDPKIFVDNRINVDYIDAKYASRIANSIVVENDFKTILRNPVYSNCDLKLSITFDHFKPWPYAPTPDNLVVNCVGN